MSKVVILFDNKTVADTSFDLNTLIADVEALVYLWFVRFFRVTNQYPKLIVTEQRTVRKIR